MYRTKKLTLQIVEILSSSIRSLSRSGLFSLAKNLVNPRLYIGNIMIVRLYAEGVGYHRYVRCVARAARTD